MLHLLLLLTFISQQPDRPKAVRLVEQALAASEDPAQARRLLEEALAADPTFGEAHFQLGELRLKEGRFKEAARSFELCIEHQPSHAEAHRKLAESLLHAEGFKAAEKVLPHLRSYLNLSRRLPAGRQDEGAMREAASLLLDLEGILREEYADQVKDEYSIEEMRAIWMRPNVRGDSRYDQPRVPVRLGFLHGDHVLGIRAKEELRRICEAFRDGPLAEARFRIEGFADGQEGGSPENRQTLSVKRAESVRDFFVQECKLEAERFETAGFADLLPLKPDDSESGRRANRRVEILNLKDREKLLRDARDR